MQIEAWLLDILACPKCHAPLRADDEASELVCTGADCGLAYPVRDGIPVLLIDEARDPAGTRQESARIDTDRVGAGNADGGGARSGRPPPAAGHGGGKR